MEARLDGDQVLVTLRTDEAVVMLEWLKHAPAHGADESVASGMASILGDALEGVDNYDVLLEAARARLNPAE
jgi:hypothetical protein